MVKGLCLRTAAAEELSVLVLFFRSDGWPLTIICAMHAGDVFTTWDLRCVPTTVVQTVFPIFFHRICDILGIAAHCSART
jgi:hypothetical protein